MKISSCIVLGRLRAMLRMLISVCRFCFLGNICLLYFLEPTSPHPHRECYCDES